MMMLTCSNDEEKLGCITYRVVNYTEKAYRCLISYKDSTGYVIFSTVDKEWSKEVSLPSGEFASLLVIPQMIPESESDDFFDFWLSREPGKAFVHGEIIHPNRSVSDSDPNIVLIQLFPQDLYRRKKFRFGFL
jgi:hypothetical protein